MKVVLKELPAQKALAVRRLVKAENLSQALGEMFTSVWGHLQGLGLHPTGPAFARYHSAGEMFDVEAGFPIGANVIVKGELKISELPAGPAAFVSYFGPYENLMHGHRALAEWMENEGFEPHSPHWEVYVSDPGAEADPNKWQTDIFQPVTPA